VRGQQRVNCLDYGASERRLVLADRLDDHRAQVALAQHGVRTATVAPDRLDAAQRVACEADYALRLRGAYPPLADGTTLFPFRRLFIVLRRS
jgi:trans-aconitate methyltransferase